MSGQVAKCIEIGLPGLIILILISHVSAAISSVFTLYQMCYLLSTVILFAVHATCYKGRKTCVRSLCSHIFCGDSLALCVLSYYWWCL